MVRMVSWKRRLLECGWAPVMVISSPGLASTKEVGADSLLCGILGILLWVPEGGSPDTQAGCLGIKVVAISG